MKKTVNSNLTGRIDLTDNDFVASGGQAVIYRYGQYAIKLYHDVSSMPSTRKLTELQALRSNDVLKPLDIVLDSKGVAIGYVMRFVDSGWPMCKLFTRTFRTDKRIEPDHVVELVKVFQAALGEVHLDKCLVVDLNEFNLMASHGFERPIFLDADSFQTPSFPATALMESVRDPLARNHFTEGSDWYSWGIIAFQLYVGMHPFKGKHPDYSPNEWRKRMDKGASVFDKGTSLPQSCYELTAIPARHLEWFKRVFANAERTMPPSLDVIMPVAVPARAVRVIRKSATFDVTEVFKTDKPIVGVYTWGGITWLVTADALWKDGRKMAPRGKEDVFVLYANGTEMFARFDGKSLAFESADYQKTEPASRVMYRDNRMYSVYDGAFFEHYVVDAGGKKSVMAKRKVCPVNEGQLKLFDGVAIQRSIDRTIVINPYDAGHSTVKVLHELDEYRIINAKAEKNVLVVIGEKKGLYHRLVFEFGRSWTTYNFRVTADVSTSEISFAVMSSGVCVLAGDDEVEVFKDGAVKQVAHPPFDSSTKLFATVNGLHYIDENIVCKVSMR